MWSNGRISCCHVLMMEDCKRHCDYLIVGLHTNPQLDRPDKNKPVQSVVERYIQLRGSKFVDEIIPYETESDLIEILKGIDYDIRFVGDDWKDKPFTGHDLLVTWIKSCTILVNMIIAVLHLDEEWQKVNY